MFAALVLLAACRPTSYEQFIRADQALEGEYVFALDLADSAAAYDLSFYTRIDPALMAAEEPSHSLGLEVSWKPAASDSVFLRESVYIPYGGKAGSVQLYRSGVHPSPAGEWSLSVKPNEAPKGLRGIGIICKRHD